MNTAYLLIGGNLGNRKENLNHCLTAISRSCGDIRKTSSIYETAAWGLTQQPSFYNQAIELVTALDGSALLSRLLSIETEMGRIRTAKMGPRVIDIDILMFNSEVIATDYLQVPHPFLPQRRFALTPLNEIAPNVRHPLLNQTVSELLAQCTDPLDVHKI